LRRGSFSLSPIEVGAAGKDEIYFHAGGQGFWVARMVANLGGKPIVCGPIGGESGIIVRALIESEGIDLRGIDVGVGTAAMSMIAIEGAEW
jgi:1-phosphofructokinase